MSYYRSHYNEGGRNNGRDDNNRKRRRYEDRPARDHYDYDHDHPSYTRDKKHRRRDSSDRKKSESRERSQRPEWDDENRHYIIRLGENLTPRYKILSVMGEGTFGKVVECWDREIKKYVAVKIIRAIEKYRDAAMIEIDVLETLKKHDPRNQQPCIQLISWFDFRGHICMVFEKYGLSVYDFLRKNAYRPFMIDDIRRIGYQLLHSVAFLHSLTLIHTDLKPENILFVNSEYKLMDCSPDSRASPSSRGSSRSSDSPSSSFRVPKSADIKLIDFGSATFDSHYHTSVVSTRHYRAPEVILGMGWTYPCDVWSIGCILVELYTGDALFQTHENREHLAMMERVFGPFPQPMIDRSDKYSKKYFKSGHVVFPEEDAAPSERQKGIDHVRRLKRLQDLIRTNDKDFYNLLTRVLDYDPDKRATAEEAMRHPFFDRTRSKNDVSVQKGAVIDLTHDDES